MDKLGPLAEPPLMGEFRPGVGGLAGGARRGDLCRVAGGLSRLEFDAGVFVAPVQGLVRGDQASRAHSWPQPRGRKIAAGHAACAPHGRAMDPGPDAAGYDRHAAPSSGRISARRLFACGRIYETGAGQQG
ncbi:hypothetical protein ACIBF1_18485 [Spirillospora sp. NPDC050679]